MASRRLRSFKRWMRSNGIECSGALSLIDDPYTHSISVSALCDLSEGDLVATIPKSACLTIRTCAARAAIEAAGLAGSLGLAVALMYERALGPASQWHDYLKLLPERESVPLVWSDERVDKLLAGTELDKTVKQDKLFVCDDWRECIDPLVQSGPLDLDPDWFCLENFFSAKTLVSSRAFEIDDYHGYGMVPLADLFNHKTGAENIHFTSVSSNSDSEDQNNESNSSDESSDEQSSILDLNTSSSASGDSKEALEIIIVRDAHAGSEVFNTYGSMGNAALLHRYGFTEPDNPFDLVNIDLTLVLQFCSSKFSNRYTRSRLSLWRKLNFSGCMSQNWEYFEISYNGEPQIELLTLLYIIFLDEGDFEKLNCTVDTSEKNRDEFGSIIGLIKITGNKCNFEKFRGEDGNGLQRLLLTKSVCDGLVSLADSRETHYGSGSLREDERRLRECCCVEEREVFHSLVLKVSERKILGRLRGYASSKKLPTNKKRKLRL